MDASSEFRNTAKVLGETMRVARARRRWSQADVASRANTTPDRISELERGAADPRLSTVERIGDALGFTLTITESAA